MNARPNIAPEMLQRINGGYALPTRSASSASPAVSPDTRYAGKSGTYDPDQQLADDGLELTRDILAIGLGALAALLVLLAFAERLA